MLPVAPPATGLRTPWHHLPANVRGALEELLGAAVTEAVTQSGGFSPGVAARLRLTDGRRVFVKAVSADTNPASPDLHRIEARHAAALPDSVPAPRLLTSYDDGTWVALVFENVDGHQPQVPWKATELERVLDAVGDLAVTLTPAPIDARPVAETKASAFHGWQQLTESAEAHADGLDPWVRRNLHMLAELAAPWPEFAVGDTLAHGDLRADNMLLTADGRVVFVDWPHAVLAARWYDLLIMLPCVRAQGGPDPEAVFSAHPVSRGADPGGVTATLAALAGYLVRNSLLPAPPGLPTLRAFQHAQGAAAVDWLRRRLGEPALP
ncbi:aminoglycoside phosphotransferase family protein [Streptomyces sp. NPDC050658]|uniref:aminoglycoside phosphotransferase family protein n=1 Tax=unclassified Streptomyces TaxID=2593676 RepID=UPI003420E6E1